jgi:hypothetical protein
MIESGLPKGWHLFTSGHALARDLPGNLSVLTKPPKEPKVMVRLMKWDRFFTRSEHKDVDITDLMLWEPPGGGWFVAAIAIGEKGLPPREDK